MAILITLATITACIILWVATALNEKIQKKIKKSVDKIHELWYNTIVKGARQVSVSAHASHD